MGVGEGEVMSIRIPKGYVAVVVGRCELEEQQRFVIPVIDVNHPLFMKLLKEAEDEYGFEHKGPIIIPCPIDHFLTVQCRIHNQTQPPLSSSSSSIPPPLPLWCFTFRD